MIRDEDFPEDWTDVDIKDYKDRHAVILAGLEQVRKTMGLTWQEVSWKRMSELVDRILALGYDFSVAESMLIGSWMAASARSQMDERNREDANR